VDKIVEGLGKLKGLYVMVGYNGSGKSTLANKIKQEFLRQHECYVGDYSESVMIASFATSLRSMAMTTLYGNSKHIDLFDNVVYDKWKKSQVINIAGWPVTGRDLMLNLGKAIRSENADFFVNATISKVESTLKNCGVVIIDDCRFKNEYDATVELIKVYGGNVIFCDYESKRYQKLDDESSVLAKAFKVAGRVHGDVLF